MGGLSWLMQTALRSDSYLSLLKTMYVFFEDELLSFVNYALQTCLLPAALKKKPSIYPTRKIFNRNNILEKYQSGFIMNRSIEDRTVYRYTLINRVKSLVSPLWC